MPSKKKVGEELLKVLFKYNGTVREFSSSEEVVNELADRFFLNPDQRTAELKRIYRKENRIVKTPLWHRLLYRAADSLAKEKLITRPTSTIRLTNKREWMLTENGFKKASELLNISERENDLLPIKFYELEKLVRKMQLAKSPKNYNPISSQKRTKKTTQNTSIRQRGFRQAVIQSYDFKCSICGLKIQSPKSVYWEVEAAHIVPHSSNGKDDIWNGVALCRLHHWAFDVGWFSLTNEFKIIVSSGYYKMPDEFGRTGNYEFFKNHLVPQKSIFLPTNEALYPHKHALEWHRNNVLHL